MAERAPMPGDTGTDTDTGTDLGADVDGEAAGDRADDGPEVVAPPRRPRRLIRSEDVPDTIPRSARTLIWQARAGLGVGLLGLILAVVFFQQAAGLRADAATRSAVLEAGELTALRITTFEGAAIDDWVRDTQSLATGDYADEVAALFDPEIRQGLADNQVESVGEITSSFVQEVDDDAATVFVVARQTFTSLAQPQPISDELRIEVELREVDGEWLAADVAILGPSTVAPVPDGTPTQAPAAEEEQG